MDFSLKNPKLFIVRRPEDKSEGEPLGKEKIDESERHEGFPRQYHWCSTWARSLSLHLMLFRIAPLNDSFYALVQCCNVSLAISHLLNRRVVRSHIGRNAGGQGNGFTAWREKWLGSSLLVATLKKSHCVLT